MRLPGRRPDAGLARAGRRAAAHASHGRAGRADESHSVAADLACIVTCEHGGNQVPRELAPRFRGRRALVGSHRGYDPGALATARTLARVLGAPLVASTVSRLVVDLNRSPGREFRGSPVMRDAPAAVREDAHARYYAPYRASVERLVREAIRAGRRVVHVSSHTFTPILEGDLRQADVGLLYDPARIAESELCERWQRALAARMPQWRVRRNYPYFGRSDGLTTHLRRRFEHDRYVGVEIEVNQRLCAARPLPLHARMAIALALRAALADSPPEVVSARDSP